MQIQMYSGRHEGLLHCWPDKNVQAELSHDCLAQLVGFCPARHTATLYASHHAFGLALNKFHKPT